MTKTKNQTLQSPIKKEECEDKSKLEKLLHEINNTSKSKTKIKNSNKPLQVHIPEFESENREEKQKEEEEKDVKTMLPSPPKTSIGTKITAEQIEKLIGYIVNDKMNVLQASKKVGLAQTTARNYYYEYKDDPEHRIPLPRTPRSRQVLKTTQEKLDSLIRYIVKDGMTVAQAAKKVDMTRETAAKYYAKYRKDPEKKIPLWNPGKSSPSKRCTQEEIANFINYIVHDKMPLVEAAKKVNISDSTARRYYLKYLYDPNYEIPHPRKSARRSGQLCTNDQISSLIRYIVNDGMDLLEASVKAHMCRDTATKYYGRYLSDPEKKIPIPDTRSRRVMKKQFTTDQAKTFFSYVIIDKLNISNAARKLNISACTGRTYYNKYVKNFTQENEIMDMSYSVEKMKRLMELVQNENMSLEKAANVVHLTIKSARKHYQQYLKNPHDEFPAIKKGLYSQEDIKRLIDCIEQEKISVPSAAKKNKINATTAYKYYRIYQNDPEHRIPVPATRKKNAFEKYTQIVADIYKNNPLIKPIHKSYDPELDVPDIEIKEEPVEEDDKMLLKIEHI